jgi:hypothetical protein
MENNNRKQLIIDKNFQFSFLKSTVLINIAALVVFIGAQTIFFLKMKNFGTDAGLPAGHVYYDFISEQQTVMIAIGVVSFLLLGLITFIWALNFSNRIAGPIYRLKGLLEKRLQGETVEIKVRENDYFNELAKLIDQNVNK